MVRTGIGGSGILAGAREQGVSRFDMPGSAEIVAEMRDLAARHPAHLTPRQKETFENIAAERDRRVARRQERQKQLSQRLGRSMSP